MGCRAGRGGGRSAGLTRAVRERVQELSKAGMDAVASRFPGKAPCQGLSATETTREGKNSPLGRKVLRNRVAISQRRTDALGELRMREKKYLAGASCQASGVGEDRQAGDARGTRREGKREARCF